MVFNTGLTAIIMRFYRAFAIDMTKLQPYNLTATVMFLQEDKNQDGVMSVTEIDDVFNIYDANGNVCLFIFFLFLRWVGI